VISVPDLVGVGLSIGGKPILHDLNLHVLPGEIHEILGMNGTGKSTLASLIMGLSGFSQHPGKSSSRARTSPPCPSRVGHFVEVVREMQPARPVERGHLPG
jgi:Fe-S cluster assembly ATP-binding protein